jgi:hypothetical protein
MGQQVGQAQCGAQRGCKILEFRQQPHHRVGDDDADLGKAPNVPVCKRTTTLSALCPAQPFSLQPPLETSSPS